MHNINLNQLRIFHAVAATGSFTRASKTLCLTQPGVSKHIKQLESDMGVPLLDRLGKTVTPTRAGRILIETTKEVFDRINEAKARINDLTLLKSGEINIGASYTAGTYLLPPVLGQYTALYPDISLSLDISLSQEVAHKVLANELDIGFIGASHPDDRLSVRPVYRDHLKVILPPDHSWQNRASVFLTDLADHTLIVSQKGSGTRLAIEEASASTDITLKRIVEFGNTEAVKKAVQAGMGVSLLSGTAVQDEVAAGSLLTKPVNAPSMERTFYAVSLQDKYRTHAVTALMGMLPSPNFGHMGE